MAAASVAWLHGGVLHYEMEGRLPYYLSNGPLLGKLYDSDYLDLGMFQARELSYLFDYVDCRFIAVCVALGHPHFLSLVQYIFLALISLVLWQFGTTDLKLNHWICLGVLLLFWTSPAIFLGGVIFRTAKVGVALAVVFLYWRIFRILHEARISARAWLGCFACAWAATLFDREGVFLVAVAVVFLAFWFFSHQEKTALKLMGALSAALGLSVIYCYIVAPLLTLSLNNYWPDFKYQHLPWRELAEKPLFFISSGLSLYFDTVRFFLGNIPLWGAVMVVFGLVYLAFHKGLRWSALGLVLSQTILIWVMIVLMVLRHEALLWPDVRRGYYMLPVVCMFAMTLLLAVSRLQSPRILAFLLCGGILGNIIALPRHTVILRTGSLSAYYQSTPLLLDALRNLRDPAYAVSPEIARNRVFQYFHDGSFSKTPVILPRKRAAAPP
jgi:hypothetical protein